MRMQRSFAISFILVLFFLLCHVQSSSAGNKWMMEKNANELIMLNSDLLKRLGTNLKDGQITLSGDVVHEDGKVIIKLYKLQQVQSTTEAETLSSEIFDSDKPYHIFMREETLSEIPPPDQINTE